MRRTELPGALFVTTKDILATRGKSVSVSVRRRSQRGDELMKQVSVMVLASGEGHNAVMSS